jgi:formylglycine-generating enzyme required for sulfatase activity/HEAT repeat protein
MQGSLEDETMTDLDKLVELLQDEDERVRSKALEAILDTGSPEAVPYVLDALDDPDEWVRRKALWGVYKLDIREAIPSVIELLKDPHEGVRGEAADTLESMEEHSAVPALVEAYRTELDAEAKDEMKDALVKLADPQAVDVYLELLSSSDGDDQEDAIRALSKAPDKRAIPRLIELLKSPGEVDRDDIIDLLIVLDATEAVPQIEKCVKDKESSVRQSAVKALGVLGREKSKKILQKAMRDREVNVQILAAQSLGMLGDTELALKSLHKLYGGLGQALDKRREVASKDIGNLIKLGGAFGRLGERDTAVELLRELNRRSEKQGWTFPERASWDLLREFGIGVINKVFQESVAEKEQSGELSVVVSEGTRDSQLGLDDPRFRVDAWYLPDEPLLGFVEIPEGPFLMGSDPDRDQEAYGDECPQHKVNLPLYYISRYPVTVAQFRVFVDESGHKPDRRDSLQGVANHPVVWVTLRDTYAYCDWLTETLREWEHTPEPLRTLLCDQGGRVTLPSEAEWEKAARGGKQLLDEAANPNPGRVYPWGDAIDSTKANYIDSGVGSTSSVGSFSEGASPYGILDLSGNVWERTRSQFKSYPYDLEDGRDAPGTPGRDAYVLRGGAYHYDARDVRCALRYKGWANHPRWHTGFRLAILPIESEPEPEEPEVSLTSLLSRFSTMLGELDEA